MDFRYFDNILAFQAGNQIVGFHAHNLQVAELSPALWKTLGNSEPDPEAQTELREWSQEIDPQSSDAQLDQNPRHLLVNVAQICNLKCSYCAAGGDGSFGEPMVHVDLEKIYEQIRTLLHDVRAGEEFTLTFFGGEPLLALENIRRLARFTRLQVAGRGVRLQFRLVTNATLISAKVVELLTELNCHITISIDGPPEINNNSRKTKGGKGSTEMTLRGLQQLLPTEVRSRLGSLTAASVFGKHHTDTLSTYQFLRQFNFDHYRFDFAAENDDSEASVAYAESLAKTADFAFSSGGELELRRLSFFDGIFSGLDSQRRIYNHCGAGKSLLTIDGRGRVSACQWFMGKPDQVLGENGTLQPEKLAQYAAPLVELNGCGACWARHLCGGGCMYVNSVKTNSLHKKDRVFCDRTRSLTAKAIELYFQSRNEQETKPKRKIEDETH
jgi:uncharacterized protein